MGRIGSSAIHANVIDNVYAASDIPCECIQQVELLCRADNAQESLCIIYQEYKTLDAYVETLYTEAIDTDNKRDLGMIAQDKIIKLRTDTLFSELFSTVDFMQKLGYNQFLRQPRELLVLQLTMVMGMLGSLVAMTWSFIRRDSTMSFRRTLFLPLVGGVSAFIIFVFFKAGQLTISSGSGTSSLSPFFLSFVGIISGLLSERAYARMESVGTKFFTDDGDQLRWAYA